MKIKRIIVLILTLGLLLTIAVAASAKTLESAKAENIFVYAADANGKSVLLKVVTLAELKQISHGQKNGENYYISSTDNYPTTQYCEARGVTVPELVDYVKSKTSVKGADKLTFKGNDTIRLMATDSYGTYNRAWTYEQLYGVKRYYFEGLFGAWNTSWEIAGTDNSKFGVTLDEYNKTYKADDANYTTKRKVFESGVPMEPILATESFSGRTTADALVASTEAGIADYIRKNGGVVKGSLKSALTDATALRLALPMTEADLMAAHRTAFDNFKWTYNLQLTSANWTAKSLGTVAAPTFTAAIKGNELTLTVSCATSGASVYYSFDGAPQTPYTKPISVDITGRNLAANPVTFYVTAVKEGYDDAGILTLKYPALAPAFKTQYSGMLRQSVTFAAADGVSAAEWSAWTKALASVTVKAPGAKSYEKTDSFKVDNKAKTVTLDGNLFKETGAYSFIFKAKEFADKTVSLTVKKPAPTVTFDEAGGARSFTLGDADFTSGLSVYVTPPGGAASTVIANKWLDKSVKGKITLKSEYFASDGCAIKASGTYVFTFVNSRYEPGTVEVKAEIKR